MQRQRREGCRFKRQPRPLGLLGFGMTTILLNIHNAGIYPLDSMIMGMGIFVGGLAQVIAGTQEWKKNNTFGTLRMNRALQVVFGTLAVLFFLLAARDFSGSTAIGTLAGWIGIVCGFSALYAAVAEVLNEVYGKIVLPLGVVRR